MLSPPSYLPLNHLSLKQTASRPPPFPRTKILVTLLPVFIPEFCCSLNFIYFFGKFFGIKFFGIKLKKVHSQSQKSFFQWRRVVYNNMHFLYYTLKITHFQKINTHATLESLIRNCESKIHRRLCQGYKNNILSKIPIHCNQLFYCFT